MPKLNCFKTFKIKTNLFLKRDFFKTLTKSGYCLIKTQKRPYAIFTLTKHYIENVFSLNY